MDAGTESKEVFDPRKIAPPVAGLQRAAIRRELDRILSSHAFRASKRSQQFLSYVVNRTLEGQVENLKERSIGVELFRRPASYSTGDDAVVRGQAAEVRRRLAQYYHEEGGASLVRIELPLGSYVPDFHENPAPSSIGVRPPLAAPSRKKRRLFTLAALGLGAVLAAVMITTQVRSGRPPMSALDEFWSPVFATSQPVLICLAKPVLYRPSTDLYRRHAGGQHTGFLTEVERSNAVPPLAPAERVRWGDLIQYHAVAMGDACVAARLSALFGRINKPSQLRIGNDYSFADLRNSPAVLVGAFNNRWTLQMTSNLHFVFVEEDGHLQIQEQGRPGRVWLVRPGPHGEVAEDYGLVTRLLDSETGQVVVAAAGISGDGTRAAGEFISTPDCLRECLRAAPPGWQKKNLQVLLHTSTVDLVAGPPRVVATHFW
jgi:hypothetical protein